MFEDAHLEMAYEDLTYVPDELDDVEERDPDDEDGALWHMDDCECPVCLGDEVEDIEDIPDIEKRPVSGLGDDLPWNVAPGVGYTERAPLTPEEEREVVVAEAAEAAADRDEDWGLIEYERELT